MSEETEELLTGRLGEEVRQGFTPMPMANPDPPSEAAIELGQHGGEALHQARPSGARGACL